jgi:hypothetical protein
VQCYGTADAAALLLAQQCWNHEVENEPRLCSFGSLAYLEHDRSQLLAASHHSIGCSNTKQLGRITSYKACVALAAQINPAISKQRSRRSSATICHQILQ